MDSTTNQPSDSSSSNDAAEPSALSALQAKIFSAFDSLVQYSTTLKAKFGGEADPRLLSFTSDVAAHLPTSINDLEDARNRIFQNLNSSSADLQVVLHSAASQTEANDDQNAPVIGQPISHSTFFPAPPTNRLRRSYALNDINHPGPDFSEENQQQAFCSHPHHWTSAKGKAKAPAQGTDAPPADVEDVNEDDDAEAVAQALSAFDTPSDEYYVAGSKTAKGKGKVKAKNAEERDDEDTAGPSGAKAAHAPPRSKVAHAAAEGTVHRSTRSDAPQAQASNVRRAPIPLKRSDAFHGKSHPNVFWHNGWGSPPSPPPPPPPPVATGSTTIHTAEGVPLRRSTRHLTSKAAEKPPVASSSRLPAEPAKRGAKRRAQEDADGDEEDNAAEASPKKKTKRTMAKKPRATRRTSRK